MNVRDYYNTLRKKDKGKFLDYLFRAYGMRQGTTRRKLSAKPNAELKKIEIEVIKKTITEGLWKG